MSVSFGLGGQLYAQIGSFKELTIGKNVTGDKVNRFILGEEDVFQMGIKVNKVFTSKSRFYPRTFTNMTLGLAKDSNYYMIDSNTFSWDLMGDVDLFIRLTKAVGDISENSAFISNGMIGQGQKEFYIDVDSNYLATGSVVMPDNNEFLLLITGDGIPNGNSTRYTAMIQGSDEASGIPVDILAMDSKLRDVSTSMQSYGLPSAPGIGKFGSRIRLRSRVGRYGREFTVDEAAIRAALRAQKAGGNPQLPSSKNAAKWQFDATDVVNGMNFTFGALDKNLKTGEIKKVPSLGFMSFLEMKVEDLIAQDREIMCIFGKAQTSQIGTQNGVNPTSSEASTRIVAPGIRQLVKTGHYFAHNGQLTTDYLQENMDSVFMTRTNQADRKVTFVTGTLGQTFLHQMVNIAAQGYFVSAKGDQLISQANQKHELDNALKFGFQFTTWIGLNGLVVNFAYDLMKDDPYFCPLMYVPNSAYTVDSARMEIFDFGDTNAASGTGATHATGAETNVAMICETEQDRRSWRVGAYHPYSGWKDVFTTDDTSSTYKRYTSGSPVIWDTTRVGAFVYDPVY